MLYQTVLLRNHQLDKHLIESGSVEAGEIIAFLNDLKECTEKYFSDPHEYKTAIIIFRKWKTLLLQFHKQPYAAVIERIPRSQNYQLKLVSSDLKYDQNEIESNQLQILSNALMKKGSTSSLVDELTKANANLLEKFPEFNSILGAEKSFYQSELNDAFDTLNKVISSLEKKEKTIAFSAFLYSWALHVLGNIAYVQYNHKLANYLFKESLKIKESINNLPLPLFYITKTKVITTSIAYKSDSVEAVEEWNKELRRYTNEAFGIDREQLSKENPEVANSMAIEFYLYLGKSLAYLDNFSQASIHLDLAILKSCQQKDVIREFRCRLFSAAVNGKDCEQNYNTLDEILASLSEEEKNDPFIRKMAASQGIKEITLINNEFGSKLKYLFEKHKIAPLSEISMENPGNKHVA